VKKVLLEKKGTLCQGTIYVYCLQFTSKDTILYHNQEGNLEIVKSEFCSRYSWAAHSEEVENMKHTHQRRSDCPINFALEVFGDPWSLLIIRDIVYFGKKTYGEFLASEEGMATNILASRLTHLEQQGILVKKLSEKDKRKEEYVLTEKGLDLIPVLVEMANWSAEYDPHTAAPAAWIALMKAEREKMIRLIRETVQSGGSVFVGEKSLVGQFV
jgi:DNA-binding HxlR family transcriptional regulator